ncbi:MAG: hypothetical protein MPL62_12185 [Alphaproteobacteria bacterium]|nr:hypothetical protein [Alphaproteobacteria bacterium]
MAGGIMPRPRRTGGIPPAFDCHFPLSLWRSLYLSTTYNTQTRAVFAKNAFVKIDIYVNKKVFL